MCMLSAFVLFSNRVHHGEKSNISTTVTHTVYQLTLFDRADLTLNKNSKIYMKDTSKWENSTSSEVNCQCKYEGRVSSSLLYNTKLWCISHQFSVFKWTLMLSNPFSITDSEPKSVAWEWFDVAAGKFAHTLMKNKRNWWLHIQERIKNRCNSISAAKSVYSTDSDSQCLLVLPELAQITKKEIELNLNFP